MLTERGFTFQFLQTVVGGGSFFIAEVDGLENWVWAARERSVSRWLGRKRWRIEPS
jgi:hypothetical protein